MAFVKYTGTNLAIGQLLGGISNSSGTLILATGQGGLFPSAFPFKLKIEQFDAQSRVIKREIVKCTNRVGDTFTITRSNEACPADYSAVTQTTTAFAFNSGDTVSLAVTADAIDDIQDEVETKLAKAGDTMTGALKLAQGVTIASATTTDLSAATGNALTISWTTTINSFWTVTAGAEYTLTFSGILTLTYNVTSMILPTSANITTAVGDVAKFLSLGSGNWKCVSYERLNWSPLSSPVIWATKTTFVAWENLTAGQPVYVSDGTGTRTAWRVYRADALDATYTDAPKFIGFAAETITSGNNIVIDTAGINSNQSGLTTGSTYYLADAVWTISTTPGTSLVVVGIATSATTILIQKTQPKRLYIPAALALIPSSAWAGSSNTWTLSHPVVSFADAAVSTANFSFTAPEGARSISAINVVWLATATTWNVCWYGITTQYWAVNAETPTWDSNGATNNAYSMTWTADNVVVNSLNSDNFNGITVVWGKHMNFSLRRNWSDGNDTYGGTAYVLGLEVIFS